MPYNDYNQPQTLLQIKTVCQENMKNMGGVVEGAVT